MWEVALCGKYPYAGNSPMREVALCGKKPCAGSSPVREVALCGESPCAGDSIEPVTHRAMWDRHNLLDYDARLLKNKNKYL